jgi:hypothetical protein
MQIKKKVEQENDSICISAGQKEKEIEHMCISWTGRKRNRTYVYISWAEKERIRTYIIERCNLTRLIDSLILTNIYFFLNFNY